MICYKDMTFCTEETCNNFGDGKCHRSLTEKVSQDAARWWGGENLDMDRMVVPPIAIFMDRPDCYEVKKEKK